MTFQITVRKDSQGRVMSTAHEELTGTWVASTSVYAKLIELLQTNFPHCTIRRVK